MYSSLQYDRMKVPFCIYIILFLLTVKNSCAQTQPVKFNLVTGSNGIALGRINGITRDLHGVTWFSDQDHQCIIRYNGTMMTRYGFDVKNPNSPNSLGGRYPECIFADSAGMIWVGFWGTGLDRLDPKTNTFTHYRHQANDPASLANDTVSAILVDHLGNLWVGHVGGLDLLNRTTNGFRHFSSNEEDSTTLSDNIVRVIYEDHAGTIWIGTGFPWIESEEEGGLNKFNRETGKFIRYMSDPENPHSLINNKVRAIFEDSRGIFWVGTGGDGLHTMERKTGTFERHTYNPAKPEQLSRPPVIKNIGDHITFITEDALGYIWIGTFGNGINRYDTATKKITHFGANAENSGGFKDISSWWINASKDGLLWLSTQEPNLYRVDLLTNNIPRYETHIGRVYSFLEEKPNTLWLGTDNGLVRKDIKTGTLHRFLNEPLNPNSLSNNTVTSITKDKEGNFWLGTRGGGINRFNSATGIFTRFQNDPKKNESLSTDNSEIVYADGESDLWIGTENGLERMIRKGAGFIHYQNNSKDTNSISSNEITTIFREDSNGLWVGTYYAGVDRMNLKTGKIKHYLPGVFITSIYKDPGGIIWVGATNGLYRYNKKSDDFLLFGEDETGFSINNVTSIIGDNQDNLWLSSSFGIYRINQKRDQIIIYNEKNGVEGFIAQTPQNSWGVSAYKGQDGKIYFGSPFGYYAFYPDKLKYTTNAPVIDSINLWLNGRQLITGSETGPKATVSKVREIHLQHDQNVFSIGFTAIDYGDPGAKKFYYKLENYDEDWRPAGAGERAYYDYVPPGKYIFRVKAANIANGVSAEKSVSIIISPPWWQTWWAYTLFALCFCAGIFLVYLLQKKRIIEKERKLGKERELEVQALRAQMNPHFIFNCLSSINHFVLKNETEAASDYLTKFSKLIRTVLNNSKKSLVSLEEELEMLRLYLDMEKLRFNHVFNYGIYLDKGVDPAGIFIPPLLFQPFAENAVWHGLMHKKDPGRLDIHLKIEHNMLICIIEDNGVGRSFSLSQESPYVKKGKSMGIQITRDRLALINGDSGTERSDFVIHDLYDEVGQAAGTKVILSVRYK
jgi:ligand-binding sensor domain-containing protein